MLTLFSIAKDDPRVLHLQQQDPRLQRLIQLIGPLETHQRTDRFDSLVRAIIGQQLSVKAAQTIYTRLVTVCPQVGPDSIARISDDALRSIGLSAKKIQYVRDLTEKVITGELNLQAIDSLEDAEIITELCSIKGIGKWTAEMFLIFSLGKQDVLSLGDAGLKRAARWVYGGVGEEFSLSVYSEAWAPYRSVVSLYLWEAINRGYVDEGVRYEEL